MSFLCCCIDPRGGFVEEGLTYGRLPKAEDECVVVPCLYDEDDERMQFAVEYPWQLQGIMTKEDFEASLDSINKAIRWRRKDACARLFCLCGGFLALKGRNFQSEIRRENVTRFERVGLSLLYRKDKVPAVDDPTEYYACGVPMHLAEWLEIRPNTFSRPAVPMGSVAKGVAKDPAKAKEETKDGEAGSAASSSGESDDDARSRDGRRRSPPTAPRARATASGRRRRRRRGSAAAVGHGRRTRAAAARAPRAPRARWMSGRSSRRRRDPPAVRAVRRRPSRRGRGPRRRRRTRTTPR